MNIDQFLLEVKHFCSSHGYLASYKETSDILKLSGLDAERSGVISLRWLYEELKSRIDYVESPDAHWNSKTEPVFMCGEVSGLVTALWYAVGFVRRQFDDNKASEELAILEREINRLHGMCERVSI